MAADIVLSVGSLAWELYKHLDDYFDGLKERDAEIEAALLQVNIFRNWTQFLSNAGRIQDVPLDEESQNNVQSCLFVARRKMEELEKFLLSLQTDPGATQSRKAWAKKHARELFYPFKRGELRELQQQLENLNNTLDRAMKPYEHQFHESFHKRTDAGLATLIELLQGSTTSITQARETPLSASTVAKSPGSTASPSVPGSPRALTSDERECLQTFRLTQGDRDASYEWYKDRVDDRVEDTCQWFLGHDNYQTWLRQRAGPLLVTADPGCGKSVLAKYLIDEGLPRDATICYFFFKDQDQNKINQALCAVLHQLFSARPDLLRHARAARERNGKELIHITAELRAIFDAAVRDPKASNTIFVFDALDECDPADLKTLVDSMNDAFLHAPSEFSVKCLMTSRPYEQVSGEFAYLVEKFPQIRIPGEQESETIRMEVERVIRVRVNSLAKRRNLSSKLQEHLKSKLLEASHRTYLWVYLVFEYLEEEAFKKTTRGLDDVLRTLPSSVNDAYEKILSRSKEGAFVHKALSFIVSAVRPLQVSELNVGLNVEAEHTSNFDLDLEEDEEFERRLRDCCGLFLTINHGKIYLLHQTAREFLLKQTVNTASVDAADGGTSEPRLWQGSICVEDAELIVAEACIAYLRNLDPEIFAISGPTWGSMELARLRQDRPENINFLLYSVQFWEYHVRWAQTSINFQSLISMLGFEDGCSDSYWRLACFERTADRAPYRKRLFATSRYQLHLSAALNHLKIVDFLVGHGASVNAASGDEIDPPLRHASLAGSGEIVQYLLEHGAKVDGVAGQSPSGRTALFATTTRFSEDILSTLLKFGADPNHRDRNGETALFFARTGTMAQLLLEAGAEVDAINIRGCTPLFGAIAAESGSVLSMLLQWKADPNAHTAEASTPLYEAVNAEWWEGSEMLLRHGADINSTVPAGKQTIWSLMAHKALSRPPQQLGTMLQLVQEKLAVDDDDALQTTPLHIAARHGIRQTLEKLLEAGARVDARDETKATPLILATSSQANGTEILELLLRAGADPNAASSTITPLLAAVHREWEDAVRLLLAAGADPNLESEWAGPSAIIIAVSFALESMLQTLIEGGANVNATDAQGRTVLEIAMELGEDRMVEILREAGAKDSTR